MRLGSRLPRAHRPAPGLVGSYDQAGSGLACRPPAITLAQGSPAGSARPAPAAIASPASAVACFTLTPSGQIGYKPPMITGQTTFSRYYTPSP